MRKFYRIEHPESGLGPYRAKITPETSKLLDEVASFGMHHPGPGRDDIFVRNFQKRIPVESERQQKLKLFKFGFKSMHLLNSWFYDNKLREGMDKSGLRIVTYRVDDPTQFMIHGRYQSVLHSCIMIEENRIAVDFITQLDVCMNPYKRREKEIENVFESISA